MKQQLEVIGFNIEACGIAQAAGAYRIELCENPAEGGTTPSFGFIKAARKLLHIQLYVIIRPRGGDFLYSNEEFEIMKDNVQLCKELNCDGVVLGLLNKDGSIDKKRTAQLVEIAYPLGVTFHRAFDYCANPFEALEDVIGCGCERILTSGQQPTALEGASLLADLIKQANDRIVIMPGSGVRSNNITEIANITGATEFHSSARALKNSDMEYVNPNINESMQSVTVDKDEVKAILRGLAQINKAGA